MGNAIRFVYKVEGAAAPSTNRHTVVAALLFRRTNGIR